MTVIDNRLTLVGGEDPDWKVTNQLAVFDTTLQHWAKPYPRMHTPRRNPAVSTYEIWLLVAGGIGQRGDLTTVELLNTSTKQWLSASSLPKPCGCLTSTVDQGNWYLITDRKQVFHVSLHVLSQTLSESADKSPLLWCCLPDSPLKGSAIVTLHGSLLTVGGFYGNHTKTDIHLYQPESKKWTKFGDLPSARCYCSCILLPSGKLLVAGGDKGDRKRTERVDVISVLN